MDKKILHNTLYKSTNYSKNLNVLLEDYDLIRSKKYSNASLQIIQKLYPNSDLFLTHSATGALEMIAMLMNIKEGDEIIFPSFTFVSSVIPFVSRGAKPIFIDINPVTLNIDESLIEKQISKNTIAILGMHYGGNSCNNEKIKSICQNKNLLYIEDAAMSFGIKNEDQYLGSFGDFAVVSFDVTKHISAIQGGLLIINNKEFTKRASKIYHVGTNRTDFFNGKKAYFEWVDIGSKFQLTETNAGVLYEQLLNLDEIVNQRIKLSKQYYQLLKKLEEQGFIKLLPHENLNKNTHLFYVLLNSKSERDRLLSYLQTHNIEAFFHYIPLHSSEMGKKIGKYESENDFTSKISETLLRLPLHTNLSKEDVLFVTTKIHKFFIS
jgi:dTDP-4-amino-4,6-dideoxygalactose transaminase